MNNIIKNSIILILLLLILFSCQNNNNEPKYITNYNCVILDNDKYIFNSNGLICQKDNIIYYSDYFDGFKIKMLDIKKNTSSQDLTDIDGKYIYGRNLMIFSDKLFYIEYSKINSIFSLCEFNLKTLKNKKIIKGLSETTHNTIISPNKNYYYFDDYFFGYGYIDLNSPDKLNRVDKIMTGIANNKSVFIDSSGIFFDDELKYKIDNLDIYTNSCLINNNYLYMPTFTIDYKIYRYDLKENLLENIYQTVLTSHCELITVFNNEIYLLKDDEVLKYNIANKSSEIISFKSANGIIFISNTDNKIYFIKNEKIEIITK